MTQEEIRALVSEYGALFVSNMIPEVDKLEITMLSYIENQRRMGMTDATIKSNLLNDIRTGGMITASFRSQFKAKIWGMSEQMSDAVLRSNYEARGVENYEWMAVVDSNTCDDCYQRSQMEARSYAEWEKIGLPGAGATQCGQRCRCDIVGDGTFTGAMKDEIKALYQERKK